MALPATTFETAPSVPLQFGGDLIGLAILFLVLAVVAAVLGAGGVAGLSMDIAKWLVIIFVVFAVTYLLSGGSGRPAEDGGPFSLWPTAPTASSLISLRRACG